MTMKKIIIKLHRFTKVVGDYYSSTSFFTKAFRSLSIWIFLCIYLLISLIRVNAYEKYNVSVNNTKTKPYRFSYTQNLGDASSGAAESKNELDAFAQVIADRYANASSLYQNCIGWIGIPEIGIDYPLMYSGDNDYYLEHDAYGRADKGGSIFIDKDCKDWNSLVLIHGHNMKDGSMFGNLDNYMDIEFAKKNKYIYTVENGVNVKYRVFSVFTLDASKEGITVDFSNKSDLFAYILELHQRSLIKFSEPDNDKVIVLNTCSYNYENAHLIVCAVKEGV